MLPSCFTIYALSMLIFFTFLSEAEKLISSNTFSKIVCNRLAPIFSISSLTFAAISAISDIESSLKTNSTPSLDISSTYCLSRLFSGSLRILIKSSLFKAESSTLFGNLPCNSGKRSDGFDK